MANFQEVLERFNGALKAGSKAGGIDKDDMAALQLLLGRLRRDVVDAPAQLAFLRKQTPGADWASAYPGIDARMASLVESSGQV